MRGVSLPLPKNWPRTSAPTGHHGRLQQISRKIRFVSCASGASPVEGLVRRSLHDAMGHTTERNDPNLNESPIAFQFLLSIEQLLSLSETPPSKRITNKGPNRQTKRAAYSGPERIRHRKLTMSLRFFQESLKMSKLTQLKNSISSFHNDERGLEALQTVMILAIAAVALILIKNHWPQVKKFFDDNMGTITKAGAFDSSAPTTGS